MPAKFRLACGTSLRRSLIGVATEVCIALPWLLFDCLNYAVACHRWAEGKLALSLGASCVAGVMGWLLVRRAADRYDDAHLGDLLVQVDDAPAWALFPHLAQTIKREHTTHCHRRWGVTARTSGWEQFRESWKVDGVAAFGCLGLVVHAWWLGL